MRPALPRRWWLVLDDQRLLFTELLPNWSLRSVTRSVSPANPQRPDVSGVWRPSSAMPSTWQFMHEPTTRLTQTA